MSKNKVVSIEQFSSRPGAPRLLAKSETQIGDVRHQRFVLKMFNQRIAFDFANLKPRHQVEDRTGRQIRASYPSEGRLEA
jgi:hypothetical protein